jgi:hypothetical protein
MRTHSDGNAKKKRKENKENKEINIPAYNDFIAYAKANKPDVNTEAVRLKFKAWEENGWKDGNGKPIKNWKSKLLNTIPYLTAAKAGEQLHDRTKTEGAPEDYGVFTERDLPMSEEMKRKFGIK